MEGFPPSLPLNHLSNRRGSENEFFSIIYFFPKSQRLSCIRHPRLWIARTRMRNLRRIVFSVSPASPYTPTGSRNADVLARHAPAHPTPVSCNSTAAAPLGSA